MRKNDICMNHNFEKAINLLEGKETEEALQIISQCYLVLGEQMFYNGEYDKAISYYQKSSEENISKKIEECNKKIKEANE